MSLRVGMGGENLGKHRWTAREVGRLRKQQNTERIKDSARQLITTNDDDTGQGNASERIETQMPKIPTQTFDLLRDGQYVLRIKSIGEPERGSYLGEPQMQVTATLEVVEAMTPGTEKMTDDATDAIGHTYDEWWSLDANTGAVKKDSKLWQIYEAATGMKLDTDDEIDTDDMIGREFQAKVVVNDPGTRNRTEHGSYGKAKRGGKGRGTPSGGGEPQGERQVTVTDEDLEEAPF